MSFLCITDIEFNNIKIITANKEEPTEENEYKLVISEINEINKYNKLKYKTLSVSLPDTIVNVLKKFSRNL
jgi:hypothetical protein